MPASPAPTSSTVDLVTLDPAPRLDVLDDDLHCVGRFPVGRVFCVGRNYADHAREMGHDPDREPPFFFMKPASAVSTGDRLSYPGMTADLHHEVELVLAVGCHLDASHGDTEPAQLAAALIGCGVGIDFTRRDLQAVAKAAGRPWEAGKVFDGAAACAPLRAGHAILGRDAARIGLRVDGELRQDGTLDQMIWTPLEVLRELSLLFGLRPGDLIFTGTPAGVGPVARGAQVEASIESLPTLKLSVR